MTSFNRFQRQTGSALIISLVFLLLLTILGVSSMQSSTLQEKMAGNSAEKNRAFQLAEAALRAGEAEVHNNSALYLNAAAVNFSSMPSSPSCQTANSWCQVSANDLAAGALAYYYIEPIANSSNTFRITGIGYGRATTNRVVLQSTFRP